ncbi:MAG: hypothetical protein JNM07_11435 [Phycisphaerae bacterium]|nr:hypothetical protein [Phycisphaerae bacterium]
MRYCTMLAVLATGAAASSASADYKVIGPFCNWDNGASITMSDMGGGTWEAVIPATPNAVNEFKVNVGDWSSSWPSTGNVKVAATGSSLTVRFYDNPNPNDGWSPNAARVGYVDQGGTGFDIIGSFDNWTNPIGSLASQGNGLYVGTIAIAPGNYNFKFRSSQYGWGMSGGSNLADWDNDIALAVGADPVKFSLDVTNGRWKTENVPTPGALGLLGLGGLVATRRRR